MTGVEPAGEGLLDLFDEFGKIGPLLFELFLVLFVKGIKPRDEADGFLVTLIPLFEFCLGTVGSVLHLHDQVKMVSHDRKTIDLAEKTFKYIELYRHFFYKFDYTYVNELDSRRGSIKKLYNESSKKTKESNIISNFDAIVEIINGIVKSRIAIELSKNQINKVAV